MFIFNLTSFKLSSFSHDELARQRDLGLINLPTVIIGNHNIQSCTFFLVLNFKIPLARQPPIKFLASVILESNDKTKFSTSTLDRKVLIPLPQRYIKKFPKQTAVKSYMLLIFRPARASFTFASYSLQRIKRNTVIIATNKKSSN